MSNLAEELAVPIICAGDIFHHWNSPAELINFALRNLPPMYAIPGQHDLPWHSHDEIRRSAYWTLVEAEVITPIDYGTFAGSLPLYGFSWNQEIRRPKPQHEGVAIAVVHRLLRSGSQVIGGDHVIAMSDYLGRMKYALGVFGDNHEPMQHRRVFNCGGFMRSRVDEEHHEPRVGIIYGPRTHMRIESHILNTIDDHFERVEELEDADSIAEFADFLQRTSNIFLDFRESCRLYLERNKISPRVAKIVLESLER